MIIAIPGCSSEGFRIYSGSLLSPKLDLAKIQFSDCLEWNPKPFPQPLPNFGRGACFPGKRNLRILFLHAQCPHTHLGIFTIFRIISFKPSQFMPVRLTLSEEPHHPEVPMSDLSVKLWNLNLAHPVIPAAGPPVMDASCFEACAKGGASVMVVKTLSRTAAVIPHPNMADFSTYFLNTELWSELSPEYCIQHESPRCWTRSTGHDQPGLHHRRNRQPGSAGGTFCGRAGAFHPLHFRCF